jgi:hypothetical protein
MAKTTQPLNDFPPFHGNISFNAQHAPLGAFFSFTCGHFGTKGGFGLQIGRPGDQDLFIGVKDGDRFSDAPLRVLPFYEGADADESARYDVEKKKNATKQKPGLVALGHKDIKRHYGYASDRWVTKDFTFTIHTPFQPMPDCSTERMSPDAILPGLLAELEVDNRTGRIQKTGIFAMRFSQPGAYILDARNGSGFAWRRSFGVRGQCIGRDVRPFTFMRWAPDVGLKDRNAHQLGSCPGIAFTVPPGEKATLRLALGCHLEGIQTTGLEGRYLYTSHFGSLDAVLDAVLDKAEELLLRQSKFLDGKLLRTKLSADQQFLLAHATRSYFGSTQLLDVGGQPFWIVNEGEYCMMNTLDLSVDHLFWELQLHPWVVRNQLEHFAQYYSYVDRVKVPKDEGQRDEGTKGQRHVAMSDDEAMGGTPRVLGQTRPMSDFDLRPGGISFCHDMGVHNNFSPLSNSSYEMPDIVGCFSYMTAEQLCNWVLMAACYVHKTNHHDWALHRQSLLKACLDSMINRGGDAGFCQYDSDRCGTGAEITTYDSLDHSLAQTRANAYMAVKTWASYLGLAKVLAPMDPAAAQRARDGAARVERTVLANVGPDGVIPAVFEKDNPGYQARILPVIEGLVYPLYWNDPALKQSSEFIAALRRHTVALLTDPKKRNLFPDGGLRLSSTSANSWMSKIAIFQHVARKFFKLHEDPKIAAILKKADAAHVKWQTETQGRDGSAYWACSDQMVNGVAKGSKYYPRIVTSVLWMEE